MNAHRRCTPFTLTYALEDEPSGVPLRGPSRTRSGPNPTFIARIQPLLADIQYRLDNPVTGSPQIPETMRARISDEDREVSAILLNRSRNGIAAIQQVWTFEEVNGRQHSSSIGSGSNPSLLLPFGIAEKSLKLYGYWHVILPGSKRYLNANGEQAGDNSDVRPPAADEVWRGGVVGARAGRGRHQRSIHRVTLTLDGVFFVDGGFAGPNRKHLWEQVVHTPTSICKWRTSHVRDTMRGSRRRGFLPILRASRVRGQISTRCCDHRALRAVQKRIATLL
jgi:hypothetical protein